MNDKGNVLRRTEYTQLKTGSNDEGSNEDDNEITSDLQARPLIRGLRVTDYENETVKNIKSNMWKKEYAALKSEQNISDLEVDPPLIRSHRPGPDRNESIQKPKVPIRGVCQCCFEDISTSTSISCSMNKHLFCFDCIRRYVQEFVYGDSCPRLVQHQPEDLRIGGGGLTRLACLAGDCGENDNGHVPHEAVEQVASERLWENYQERIFRLEFHQQNADQLVAGTFGERDVAGQEDMANRHQIAGNTFPAAPRYAHKKSIEDNSTSSKVDYHSSSRQVRRDRASLTASEHGSTTPSRWSTSQEQRMLNSESDLSNLDRKYRHVEEALTESKLRKCPACNTPFLKETGCNKLRCPGCRVYICYICRGILPKKGYTHFCQHKYDTCDLCSKCPLWTSQDEQKDQERLRQVATDETNRIWEDTLLSEDRKKIGTISLDVERLLHDPSVHASSSQRNQGDPPGTHA